ncbi:hypothetical protein [Pedobacter sp. GR22-6]|uniref:hypothetical protein n=1 Tax=Pedobacter sp. GR22-6 TaxID=3127957 RepID=UPI00307E1DDE
MTSPKQDQILDFPMQQLKLSGELKRAANAAGIKTLRQLCQHRTDQVQSWPGFNIQLVHEYVNYLEQNGLGNHVDHW